MRSVLEIPQKVKDAVTAYVHARQSEKNAQKEKEDVKHTIMVWISRRRETDPMFTSFEVEDASVSLVTPTRDEWDVDGLYKALKNANQLTPEVQQAFVRTVDSLKLWELAEQLKVDRRILKRFYTSKPMKPYINVTEKQRE